VAHALEKARPPHYISHFYLIYFLENEEQGTVDQTAVDKQLARSTAMMHRFNCGSSNQPSVNLVVGIRNISNWPSLPLTTEAITAAKQQLAPPL